MLRTLFFFRAYHKKQFSQALAQCTSLAPLDNAYQLYACCRLDMHQTVSASPTYTGKNWRGGLARAISLAACGRKTEAEQETSLWLEHRRSNKQKILLAKGLAAFHPELAQGLLENVPEAVLLRVGICQRLGRISQARDLLATLSALGEVPAPPEYSLFLDNAAMSLSPADRLAGLNRFLLARGVSELSLVNAEAPPSPLNVVSAADLPEVQGPLVSVLMTAFNSAQRIMSAIQSLLNQTYRNIELVVIDDASNDTTGQIVQNMATQDHRIRFLRLPRNVGTYVAKNIGLEYATGEFVTCHDSDDWAHPLKIERQVAPLLADSKLVFTTSYWVRMQDDGIYYARPVYPLMRLNPASPLFRKQQVLELAGAWDPVRTGADSEFLARLKLVFGPQRMKRIMQPLTLGSHHPDSLMTAQKTGYNADGMSPSRLAYWESWNRWHVDRLRTKRIPKLEPFTSSTRSFLAPQEIQVPFEDIDYCVQQIRKKNG